jgi:hypothetical protein
MTELCSAEAAGESTATLSTMHAVARSSDSAVAPEWRTQAVAPERRTPLSEVVATLETTLGVSACNRQQVEEDQLGRTGAIEYC